MAPRKKQAGKRNNQAPPELEPSKRPKGQTASVWREKAQAVQEAVGPPRHQRKVSRKQAEAQAHAQASHSETDVAAVDLPKSEAIEHSIAAR
ncbi:hypothetical protein QL285_063994 [Trifolium repens]|nr:hypothetical protein QL285_063994 [Trifolium repens]